MKIYVRKSKNMIKYLAFDLDGTLLTSRGIVDLTSINSIKDFCDNYNCKVILISGRHLKEMLQTAASIKTITDSIAWLISCDGLYIYDKYFHKIYEKSFLSLDDVKLIVKRLNLCKVMCVTDSRDYILTTSYGEYIYQKIKNVFNSRTSVHGINWRHQIDEIEKVIVSADFDQCKRSLENVFSIHAVSDAIEIMCKNVNKFEALRTLCIQQNIDLDNILYFGDAHNDIECFQKLKNSVAMDNAPYEIKRLASYVTKNNDSHGIASALSHYSNVIT